MTTMRRKAGAGLAALALAMTCAVPAGTALASEGSGDRSGSDAGASEQQGEDSGLGGFLGALGDLWDSTVSGGQSDEGRSSIGDYLDYALGSAAGAWDDLAAQWPEMRDALSSAAQDAKTALAQVSDEVLTALEQTKSDLGRFVDQVGSVQVRDAQTEKVLAEITDRAQVGDVLKGLDFAKWTSTSEVPSADSAQTHVAFMLSKKALGFSDGLLDGAAKASSAADGASASDVEQLSFTTYRGSQVISVSILGASGPVAQFTAPQADVDALNALAKTGK